MQTPVDLLIADTTLFAMDRGEKIQTHTTLAVSAGRIQEIGPVAAMAERYAPQRTIDARNMLAMPG